MHRFLFITLLFTVFSCSTKKVDMKPNTNNKNKSSQTITTDSSSGGMLSKYDLENEDPFFVKIPDELKEISGITFTDDDRLFAHGDEDGDIFQLNPETGEIIKRFSLGSMLVVNGDFEDIAYVNDKYYLLESKGKLYEFKEGTNGSFIDYKTYKTFLNSSNDVEGLCFDSGTNSLLLACKGSPGEGYDKQKAVYSFSLSTMTLNETPRFLIDLKSIKKNTTENEFSPSGIARHPISGSFFIIAAKGNTIIELSKDGTLLTQKDLSEKVHKQAEGIAFMKDGTLYISNEGKNKTARLVKYDMK